MRSEERPSGGQHVLLVGGECSNSRLLMRLCAGRLDCRGVRNRGDRAAPGRDRNGSRQGQQKCAAPQHLLAVLRTKRRTTRRQAAYRCAARLISLLLRGGAPRDRQRRPHVPTVAAGTTKKPQAARGAANGIWGPRRSSAGWLPLGFLCLPLLLQRLLSRLLLHSLFRVLVLGRHALTSFVGGSRGCRCGSRSRSPLRPSGRGMPRGRPCKSLAGRSLPRTRVSQARRLSNRNDERPGLKAFRAWPRGEAAGAWAGRAAP